MKELTVGIMLGLVVGKLMPTNIVVCMFLAGLVYALVDMGKTVVMQEVNAFKGFKKKGD